MPPHKNFMDLITLRLFLSLSQSIKLRNTIDKSYAVVWFMMS